MPKGGSVTLSSEEGSLRLGVLAMVIAFLLWMPCLVRSNLRDCVMAVMLQATTTAGGPGAEGSHESTRLLSVSSMICLPSWNAGTVLRSSMSFLYQLIMELGSASSLWTLTEMKVSGMGSQVLTPGLEKPALGPLSHCMGVRSPSRPFSLGQPVMPMGSRTSALRVGCVVFMPISSP